MGNILDDTSLCRNCILIENMSLLVMPNFTELVAEDTALLCVVLCCMNNKKKNPARAEACKITVF